MATKLIASQEVLKDPAGKKQKPKPITAQMQACLYFARKKRKARIVV